MSNIVQNSTDPDFARPASQLTPLVEFLWDNQTYYLSEAAPTDDYDFPNETVEVFPGNTYYRNRRNGADNRYYYSATRYARSEETITIEGSSGNVTFTAEPSMEIDLGKALNAGVESMPAKIRLPSSVEPVAQMSHQDFSRVRVNVYDYQPETLGLRHVFGGDITKTVKRPQGRSLITEVEFEGIKKKFESTPVGLRLTTLCGWIYGDCNCAASDKDEYHICKVIQPPLDADPELLYVNELPGILDNMNENLGSKINRGWVAKVLNPTPLQDGESVAISGMKYQIKSAIGTGGGVAIIKTVQPWMDRLVPGDVVAIYGGCDKQVETCKLGHANTSRFGGFGMFIPLHNPITEANQ